MSLVRLPYNEALTTAQFSGFSSRLAPPELFTLNGRRTLDRAGTLSCFTRPGLQSVRGFTTSNLSKSTFTDRFIASFWPGYTQQVSNPLLPF